jgi:hypothetical protein
VSAEGILSARVASICARRWLAVGIWLYLRLIFAYRWLPVSTCGCGKSSVIYFKILKASSLVLRLSGFRHVDKNLYRDKKTIPQGLKPSFLLLYGPTKVVP